MGKIVSLESYKNSKMTLDEARKIIFAAETGQAIPDSIIGKAYEISNAAGDFWLGAKLYKNAAINLAK